MKGALMKVGPAARLHPRGSARGRPAGAGHVCRPTRRRWRRAWPRRSSGRSWATTPSACSVDWEPVPVAAASVGQVHRAVLHGRPDRGRQGAVPGRRHAPSMADLDNAEVLYGLFSAFALKGLDVQALVDELRDAHGRRARLPASRPPTRPSSPRRTATTRSSPCPPWCRSLLDAAGAHHRVGRRPAVGRVPRHAPTAPARQRAGEIIFRFAQGSVHRLGVFNGDPHPGNYRFLARRPGHVPRLRAGEAVDAGRVGAAVALPRCHPRPPTPTGCSSAMEDVELPPGRVTGSTPQAVFDYVSTPYRPYLTERFTVHPRVRGGHRSADRRRQRPARRGGRASSTCRPASSSSTGWSGASSALLGKLEAEGPWRGILAEYRDGGPPCTAARRAGRRRWRARRRTAVECRRRRGNAARCKQRRVRSEIDG